MRGSEILNDPAAPLTAATLVAPSSHWTLAPKFAAVSLVLLSVKVATVEKLEESPSAMEKASGVRVIVPPLGLVPVPGPLNCGLTVTIE